MIALNKLDFSYPGSKQPLFSQLDMQLRTGTICGLLGPNGAGKSTLLKILSGLLFPTGGSCRIDRRIPAERHPDLLQNIFLLPEDIYVPALTARQYLSRYSCFYPKFDRLAFTDLMAEFKLPLDKKLNKLSQGQKKKFLLAFGIATNTRLLIMDEPSNGLDIPSKSQFRRILVKHYSEERSFIISTHQVHDLEGLIDSVMIFSDGRVLLHEDLDSIGARLTFSTEFERPEQALYYEESLKGFEVVSENDSGAESQVDLGLLFGFVTSHTQRAQQLMQENSAHG